MLVNIWASIVHLADTYFCSTTSVNKGLDLLICQEMSRITKHKQTWMINSFRKTPGSTGDLLRDGYGVLKGSAESYLILYMPGFADAMLHVPIEIIKEQLEMLCERALVFRKRMIGITLGFPPLTPPAIQDHIREINVLTSDTIKKYFGQIADLTDISYEPWDDTHGSRPLVQEEVAKRIAQAILLSHPEPEAWKNL